MILDEVVRKLCKVFAPEAVKIRTAYHLQVIDGEKRHDVWLPDFGPLKFKMHGDRKVSKATSVKGLISAISKNAPTDVDIATSSLMEAMERRAINTKEPTLFCDAGWKTGRAKMGALLAIGNGETHWNLHTSYMPCITTAECASILFGLRLAGRLGFEQLQARNDSKEAVRRVNIWLDREAAIWVPREQNREVDRFANARN